MYGVEARSTPRMSRGVLLAFRGVGACVLTTIRARAGVSTRDSRGEGVAL